MENNYKKIENLHDDPVYNNLFWAAVDDSPHNQFLQYSDYLHKKLELLKEGKMAVDEYNTFLEKGVLKVLQEKMLRDNNSELLRKIKSETPELLK